MHMVVDLCERTIVICNGRVTADGPTLQIFENQSILAESHLEKPLGMQGCPVCKRSQVSVPIGEPTVL